ncbi:MAG: hypothetical protein QM796_10210 [Chthoniobacteraceae bacterium]
MPRIFCLRPHELMWRWPASFIEVNLQRLLELGRVDEAWAQRVRMAFATATADPTSLMFTPILLEIVAERLEGEVNYGFNGRNSPPVALRLHPS